MDGIKSWATCLFQPNFIQWHHTHTHPYTHTNTHTFSLALSLSCKHKLIFIYISLSRKNHPTLSGSNLSFTQSQFFISPDGAKNTHCSLSLFQTSRPMQPSHPREWLKCTSFSFLPQNPQYFLKAGEKIHVKTVKLRSPKHFETEIIFFSFDWPSIKFGVRTWR